MIYEFVCDTCGKKAELEQRMNDEHSCECSECKQPMRRLYDFVDQYKGEGFTRSADAREEEAVWK